MPMNDETYRLAKEAFDKAKQERYRWEPLWEECAELTQPEYMDMSDNWDPKDLIGDNVYDGSPRVAAQIVTAGLFGYSCNPADEWASIALDGPLRRPAAVRDYITDVNRTLMSTFEKYDVYKHLIPAFSSIVPIGTATLTVEEDLRNNGIRYRFWHPGDYVIGTDAYNEVNQFGTEKEYLNHQLLDLYSPEELGSEAFERIKANPWDKTTIYYMIMPNNMYKPGHPFANRFKYSGYHLMTMDNRIIRRDGFNEFPAAVWRWTVQGRLTYGLGMAAKALPDIYVLNQSARTRLEAEQKMADPPMNIPAEMMDDYHLGAGGRNFYRSPDRPITGTGTSYDYPAAIDSVNRYTDIVNKHFLTDFFVTLAGSTTRRTTQEVAEIQQEKASMLGPIISFMNKDFLDKIISETLRILSKQGKLPDPPQEILDQEYHIQLLGPLALAQKQTQIERRIIQPVQMSLQYAQMDPSVLDNFNFDTLTRLLGESYNIPYGILREETEVAMIRKERVQAQQLAAKQEQENQENQTIMQHGTKAIEKNSLLDMAQQGAENAG